MHPGSLQPLSRPCFFSVWILFLALAGCGKGDGQVSTDAAFTGQAILGPLANAQVALYSLSNLSSTPLYTTTTTQNRDLDKAGLFAIPKDRLANNELYLIKVSGGVDLDADDDGQPDPQPTPNRGAIHAVLTAAQIRHGNFHVSVLTEVLYRRLYYLLAAAYPPETLLAEIHLRAGIVLAKDLDGDGDRDADDASAWHPRRHPDAPTHGLPAYRALAARIRSGAPLSDTALALTDRILSSTGAPGGSQIQDVTVAGNQAYVITREPLGQEASRLHLFDIGNPAQPRLSGSLTLPGASEKIAVAGRLAGVIGHSPIPGGPDKLWLIAVHDPAHPALLSTVEVPAYSTELAIAGDRVYVAYEAAANSGLQVFRITPGGAPTLLGSVFIPDELTDLKVVKNIAYLAEGNAGLRLVDVADPANPREIGRIASAGPVQNIAVAGSIAYLTDEGAQPDGTGALFKAVDVGNPARPALLGSTPIPGFTRALQVDGRRAYLIEGLTASSIRVIDIGKPAAPKVLGPVATPGTADALAVADDIAYVADGDALRIIHLNSPLLSPALASWAVPLTPVQGLVATGNRVYLAAGGSLFLIDAGDPVRLRVSGFLRAGGEINALKVAGNHAYLTGTAPGPQPLSSLHIIAIDNPSMPTLSGELVTLQGIQDMAVAADLAYLTETNALRVIAIGDPRQPTPIGSLTTAGKFGRIEANPPVAYVAEYADNEQGFSRLVTVDIRNPFNPVRLGALATAGIISGLVRAGKYLYLTDSAALRVIDVGNPAQPVQLSETATPKPAWDMAVSGTVVYLADGESIRMIDTGNPLAPVPLGAVTLPGEVTFVAAQGDYLYAATLGSVHILRLPRRPVP